MPNVSHLECGLCGKHFVPGKVYNCVTVDRLCWFVTT